MRRALLAIGLVIVGALPATATPLVCADPCDIPTNSVSYVPPVTEIASGTIVRWLTRDTSHPTADTADPSQRCFVVAVGSVVEPVPVRFTLLDGILTATTNADSPSERSRTCMDTSTLPGGGVALPFQCLLHPWMYGTLVIDPA